VAKQFAFHIRPDQRIQLIDVATGKLIRSFKGHFGEVSGLAFTADGATLFSGSADHTVRAWDVASGKEKRRYGDEKQECGYLAVSPDQKTLAYRAGFLLHFRDLATDKDLVPPWDSSPWKIGWVVYSPDGKKVALGGSRIAILDTATGKRINPSPASESHIHQVVHSPDGKVLAVWRGWPDQMIELWDTAKGRKVAILRPKNARFDAMAFSPDGNNLTTSEGNFIQENLQWIICHWDVQTGKRKKEFPRNGGWIDSLFYSPDGKTLGYLDFQPRGNAFVFLDAASGTERGRIPALNFPDRNRNPQLSADGRVLAWGAPNRTIVEGRQRKLLQEYAVGLWDTKTGKLLRAFGDRNSGSDILPAFSPDGRTLARPGKDRSQIESDIVLWETTTGKERLRIVRNDGKVRQITFSPNGRLLASVYWQATIPDWDVHVWDAWTGKEVGQLTGHRGEIRTFSFAPDGKTLASSGGENTILIWDVTRLLPATKLVAAKLSREELTRCWDDLAGTDATRAYATIAELARHPDQAENLLKEKLASHSGMDLERLARLIANLDSDDFKTRESASKELANHGRLAEGGLRKALDENPSPELKRRIQSLLDRLDPKQDDPEQIRLLRAIEVLERLGTPKAHRLLQKLTRGASIPDVAREAQASLERLSKEGKGVP
jgi:WD40 repeat protein